MNIKTGALTRKIKQGCHLDAKEFFEPITKRVNKTSENLAEESKATTAAIENVVKVFPGTSSALADTQKIFSISSKAMEKQEHK